MSKLLDKIKKNSSVDFVDDKNKLYPYPSGFQLLDWHNVREFTHPLYPDNADKNQIIGGIPLGKMTHISGYTGTGKSTLAIQIAMNVCKNFSENSFVIHFDQEDAFNRERVSEITGLSLKEVKERYHRTHPTTINDAFTQITQIYNEKTENRQDYLAKNQFDCEMLVPTFFIIDTVVDFLSWDMVEGETDEEKITNSTYSSFAQAKSLNSFFQRLPKYMSGGNITVIAVNHVRPFISDKPTPRPQLHMGSNETIPGGQGQLQLSDFQLKMRATEKLKEDKTYKIFGHINQVSVIKTRNDVAGRTYHLVFNPDVGFDDFYSSMYYLQNEKLLNGNPRGYYLEIDGKQSTKFTLANAKKKYEEDEEFKEIFDYVVDACLYERRFG